MAHRGSLTGRLPASPALTDDAGAPVADRSGIPAEFADALYRTTLREAPTTVLEVGMANGFSSIAILSALRELGGRRRLISIDPYQQTDWRSVGLTQVRRAGFSDLHELIAEPDFLALPDLLRRATVVDLAYIDGWHTFDYTLLDFWYIDRMLRVGGVVAFNDCGLRSVHKAIGFVTTHRHYAELDVGLAPQYRSERLLGSLRRRLTGRNGADRYFRRLDDWQPSWEFFAKF